MENMKEELEKRKIQLIELGNKLEEETDLLNENLTGMVRTLLRIDNIDITIGSRWNGKIHI